jgi:hypothetical protein
MLDVWPAYDLRTYVGAYVGGQEAISFSDALYAQNQRSVRPHSFLSLISCSFIYTIPKDGDVIGYC